MALFFLSELYGPADLSKRYAEVDRLMPLAVRVLPVSGLEVIADAIEMDALSESLDADMMAALGEALEGLDDASYGAAYRQIGRAAERVKQIGLIGDLGLSLDRLAGLPMARGTLRRMRLPARLVGMGELQNFLERGFEAFHAMGGAAEFVSLIVSRETTLSKALFAGDDRLLGEAAAAWGTGGAWETGGA